MCGRREREGEKMKVRGRERGEGERREMRAGRRSFLRVRPWKVRFYVRPGDSQVTQVQSREET